MPRRLTTSDLNHALRGAVISGSVELLDKSIQAGAEVHVHLSLIGSAMQSAAYCANLGAVDAFSRHGTRADEPGDIYRPRGTAGGALESAVISGNQQVVELLVRNGADVHRCTAWHGSPLTLSLQHLNTSLVEYLLSQGADPAVFCGYEISYVQSVAFLPESWATCRVLSLFLEAKTGCRGVNLNPYPCGSPLQVACYLNRQEQARILLSKGAEVHATSRQLGDAMQSASRPGHGGLVTDLLHRGGDADSGQDSWPRAR